MSLPSALTEAAENGAFGVGVKVGVRVGVSVSVAGTKLADVEVAGGVMDGNKVAVGERKIVGVTVQVGSICKGVMVAVGVLKKAGLSGFIEEPGSRNTMMK